MNNTHDLKRLLRVESNKREIVKKDLRHYLDNLKKQKENMLAFAKVKILDEHEKVQVQTEK